PGLRLRMVRFLPHGDRLLAFAMPRILRDRRRAGAAATRRQTMAALGGRSGSDDPGRGHAPLAGIRVVELADEQAEYCGLALAGLGADVVKVEPPSGSPTRTIGPFYQDRANPERSLFFWQYNRG